MICFPRKPKVIEAVREKYLTGAMKRTGQKKGAQAGAVCALSLPENKGKIAFFAGIDKARFRGTVGPGDTLELHVTMTKKKGPIGFGDAVATVNGKKVVTAEISFAVADPAPKSE